MLIYKDFHSFFAWIKLSSSASYDLVICVSMRFRSVLCCDEVKPLLCLPIIPHPPTNQASALLLAASLANCNDVLLKHILLRLAVYAYPLSVYLPPLIYISVSRCLWRLSKHFVWQYLYSGRVKIVVFTR